MQRERSKKKIEELPVMPVEMASGYEPDCIVLAASDTEDEEILKYKIFQADYRGEVISLYDFFRCFSSKTAALRKMAWRLTDLGVEGDAADLGTGHGDVAWQLNALMPDRALYLFDTFTGCDARDTAVEEKNGYSDTKVGAFAFTAKELDNLEGTLLARMPYPRQVVIRKGWFPETAFDLEENRYALVHIDTGLYQPTYSAFQYFYPRMSPGGVILLSGYEDGKRCGVAEAVRNLEAQYGAFLIAPLCDWDGTILIMHP